jgi:cytochrome c-type biogenesis protein
MTDGWVDYLTGPWGFALAFAAGLLSFLSPCVLPLVPAYLAHLTGTAAESDQRDQRRETVTHALTFVLGFTLVFTFVGASVGLIGAVVSDDASYAVRDQLPLLGKIAGVFLIVLGLNLVGVIKIPFLYRTYAFETSPRPVPAAAGAGGAGTITMGGGRAPMPGIAYAKSLGVGAAFAVGWTPCIGPVLGTILTLSAQSADVARGGYLLLVYSLGLGVPFVVTALAVAPITGYLRRNRWMMPLVEVAMGVLIIVVGVLMFTDDLTIFNRYFDFFGLSQI